MNFLPVQSHWFSGEHRFAVFNAERTHRYALGREWDNGNKKRIAFIGLNPSTADDLKDDPTIRRVVSFAKKWGYGGVVMLNLFAIISADPKVLLTCADPIGINDLYLREFLREAIDEFVFCWGGFDVGNRAETVIPWFNKPLCLGQNADGSPKHPLYLKGDTQLQLFNRAKMVPRVKVRNFLLT